MNTSLWLPLPHWSQRVIDKTNVTYKINGVEGHGSRSQFSFGGGGNNNRKHDEQ